MSSRRNFLRLAAATAGASALTFKARAADSYKGTLCLFSKHLPEMDWPRLAWSVKRLGFGGVDLTVRPGGHETRNNRVLEDEHPG